MTPNPTTNDDITSHGVIGTTQKIKFYLMKQLSFFLLFFPALLLSQVTDNFSDGNFTQNPTWTGDDARFIVNADFQLQLKDTAAGTSYLGTANQPQADAEWRCYVRLAFSPSSNNFARYYLISDQPYLTLPLNGYFVQIGESGSGDALELFKQEGEIITSICRGIEGLIASSFAISIKITKNPQGVWKMYADPFANENYQLEAEGVDNSFTQTTTLGFVCTYTSSNSSKFYFDDVYAGPVVIDNTAPLWTNIWVTNDSTLMLAFDESLLLTSVVNLDHYEANNGLGKPRSAALIEEDPTTIQLIFENKFPSGQTNLITVYGIQDLAENQMQAGSMEFVYYQAAQGDVVINEIMADPNPVVGLPDFEYLELYNTSPNSIDLTGWKLTIGTTDKIFESGLIPSNGYLIVSKETAETELSPYGIFYGFSSFTLTNAGQSLWLTNKEGLQIDQLTYSDQWYKDPDKADGGWALEQMNPKNYCSGSENWGASKDEKGGTPGTQNSNYNEIVLSPAPAKLTILANNILQLSFNQLMDKTQLQVLANYTVDNNMGNPQFTYLVPDDLRKIELYFETSFVEGQLYYLTVFKNLTNCAGQPMKADTSLPFGLPETIGQQDIVINELLFNPWTDGVDYVELFNRSQKVLDLSGLSLGSVRVSPPNPPDTTSYPLVTEQQLITPGAYLVLTSSPDVVQNQYYTQNKEAFLRMESFPAFNNDSGQVLLQLNGHELIDNFRYNEDMQFPLLNYVDGVALERINPDLSAANADNWHSAAESVGFGTPGYLNSQYLVQGQGEDPVHLMPEIFSPDNDGYQDVITIEYQFEAAGYILNVLIFNSEGQKIRELVNNQYLGTSGMAIWDGIMDDNSKAPVGIYVFYIEVFDLDGNVKKYKKVGVLATNLQ